MNKWYCDASATQKGDYGHQWTGTGTCASGTTITSVSTTTGTGLTANDVGAYISGTNIPQGTYIVSGSGGPPYTSVVISQPVTGAISGTLSVSGGPVAGGTVPTKAEDGNGKATGAAAMATLVVTIAAALNVGDTVTIAGVVFTAGNGTTGQGQFDQSSGNTTTIAASLRDQINANTAGTPTKPTGVQTVPLRNLVNATSSGNVVTVYTRIAGSEWNSATESENTSNARIQITTQWAGGTDGAWGWYTNPLAIPWGSSVAAGAYGAQNNTYLNIPAAGDQVYIRTKRSGSNILVDFGTSGGTRRAVGTLASPLDFIADAGVEWSGDSGIFTLALIKASTSVVWPGGTTGMARYLGTVTNFMNGGTSNFLVLASTPSDQNYTLTVALTCGNTGRIQLLGVELKDANTGAGTSTNLVISNNGGVGGTSSPGRPMLLSRSIVRFAKQTATLVTLTGNGAATNVKFSETEIIFSGQTASNPKVIVNSTGNYAAFIWLDRCKFSGLYSGGTNQVGVYPTSGTVRVLVTDTELENLNALTGSVCGVGYLDGADGVSSEVMVSNSFGDRQFLFENTQKICEWRTASFPVTGESLLPDGTAWSMRLSGPPNSGNYAGLFSKNAPIISPHFSKYNSLADGTRTFTLRLLVHRNFGRTGVSGTTPYDDEMWVSGQYVDTSNVVQRFTTHPGYVEVTRSALTDGTLGDWSPSTYLGATYDAYELSATLTNLKGGTDVTYYVHLGKQTSSGNDLVFIDPEGSLV